MQPSSVPNPDWGDVSEPEWASRPFCPDNEALVDVDRMQSMDEIPLEEVEVFEPRPLKSRRLEQVELGELEDDSRRECFGCVYFGEGDTTLVSDDVAKLEQMARESFGRTDLVTLARAMHDFYESKIRRAVSHDERPLPPWSPAHILEHLRHHNQDPLVQQVVLLAEVQELRTSALDHCFEQSKKNGRVRINKAGIEAYERLTKLQLHIQKQDASKQAFYSASARVNPEILSQGALSWNTKKMHSNWKK